MGEYRHRTDRSEVTIIAECPQADGENDHLCIQAEAETTDEDAEAFIEEMQEIWPDCGCGRELDYMTQTTPTEVLD